MFWEFFSATLGVICALTVPTCAVFVAALIVLAVRELAKAIESKMKN